MVGQCLSCSSKMGEGVGDARQGQDWIGVLWSVTCLLEGLGLPFWVISGVFPVSLSGLLQEEGWEVRVG